MIIDLNHIPNRMCYPPRVAPPKSQFNRFQWNVLATVFEMGGRYIIWSVSQGKVLKRKWTKFGLKRAIKKLEKQGFIVEKDR